MVSCVFELWNYEKDNNVWRTKQISMVGWPYHLGMWKIDVVDFQQYWSRIYNFIKIGQTVFDKQHDTSILYISSKILYHSVNMSFT